MYAIPGVYSIDCTACSVSDDVHSCHTPSGVAYLSPSAFFYLRTAWLANTEGPQFCSSSCLVTDGAQPENSSKSCSLAGCSQKPLHHRHTGKALDYCSEEHRVRHQQLATVRFSCGDARHVFQYRLTQYEPTDSRREALNETPAAAAPTSSTHDQLSAERVRSSVASCFWPTIRVDDVLLCQETLRT